MRLTDTDKLDWWNDLYMKGVNHSGVWVRYRDVKEFIENAPTIDAVPVIRCKNCIHVQECKNAQHLGLEGYCSYGERDEE